MLVTKLTVVNACLASMGEEPINSLAEVNAFVSSALFALENANLNEQSEGWYFNKEQVELVPDVNGEYHVPHDVLDLDTMSNPGWMTIRKNKLFTTAGGKTYTGTGPMCCNVIRLLDFEDLPFIGKRLVKAATVILFQQSYDGDAVKIKEAEDEYSTARILCKAQHIRQVKANFGTYAIRQNAMLGPMRGLRTPR